MAIKKAPITAAWQVNLYCDKCGKPMNSSGMVFDCQPPVYEYVCECGHTERSSQQYPHQIIQFDLTREEEMFKTGLS